MAEISRSRWVDYQCPCSRRGDYCVAGPTVHGTAGCGHPFYYTRTCEMQDRKAPALCPECARETECPHGEQ